MRRLMVGLAALLVLTGACSSIEAEVATTVAGRRTSTTTRPINAVLASHSLVPFDACDDYLSYVKEQALQLVGPYGLHGSPIGYPYPAPFFEDLRAFAAVGEDDAGETAPTTTVAAGTTYSGTNTQEQGVDEPDLVKTDGRRIVTLLDGILRIATVDDGALRRGGNLAIDRYGYAQDMFLSGDRILVLVAGDGYPILYDDIAVGEEIGVAPPWYPPSMITRLVEIDIADVDEPAVVRTMDLDGRYLSARMVDDTVRVVFVAQPTGLVFTYPEGGGLRAERDAEAENRRVVEDSTVDNWLPYYVTKDRLGRVIDEGTAIDCSRAHHPDEFAGLNLLSVLTLDLATGLSLTDSTGVLANGETVYASPTSLYVATQQWIDWSTIDVDAATGIPVDTATTEIHRFDTTDPKRTEYRASGSVEGWLLNQWSFSEHDDHLRVVVTNAPAWQRWGQTESSVVVLREEAGELRQVGSVGGLGKDENVYAIRFMGDIGYVVTFRQIDPLYTIDLSDPENPKVMGELKIPGFSSYLHPVGEGLLLGVGQDATEQGQVRGAQVSLFDVSDLRNPQRIDQVSLGDGNSAVEWDHRAFLYWDGLAAIPVQSWGWDDDFSNGVVAISVEGTSLEKLGTVSHDWADRHGWGAHIHRSLVIGDHLYTVSAAGVMQSDLEDLESSMWMAW